MLPAAAAACSDKLKASFQSRSIFCLHPMIYDIKPSIDYE